MQKPEEKPDGFLDAAPGKAEKFEAVDLARMELQQTRVELATVRAQFTAERTKSIQLEAAVNVMKLNAQRSAETANVQTERDSWTALVLEIEDKYHLKMGDITYNTIDGTITHKD